MKKFFQFIGPKQNWSPVEIQKKFKFKNSDRWNLTQKIVKPVEKFQSDPLMGSTLRNGHTFLACFLTENLEALNPNRQGLLRNFLNDYEDPFIWSTARGLELPKKTPFQRDKLDEEFFEVRDLDFAKKDREEPINVKCAYDDLIMVVVFECDEKVSIMVNSKFFTTGKSRQAGRSSWVNIKPLEEFKTYFQRKSLTESRNVSDKVNPGTSGISVARSSSVRSNSDTARSQPKESSKSTPQQSSQSTPQESSQENDCLLESESRRKSKAGRKRRRESAFNTVRFTSENISIETETKSQTFLIESISSKMSFLNKQWIGKTSDERKKQWDEIFNQSPFNLFERVESGTADGLKFFRFHEILSNESQDAVEKEWGRIFINTPYPKETLCYIIFDSYKKPPYLGLLNISFSG